MPPRLVAHDLAGRDAAHRDLALAGAEILDGEAGDVGRETAIIIYWNTLKLGDAVSARRQAGLEISATVTVTARKREENVEAVPFSVAAPSGQGPAQPRGRDHRGQQVEAGDPVVLPLAGSVPQFPALVEVDGDA